MICAIGVKYQIANLVVCAYAQYQTVYLLEHVRLLEQLRVLIVEKDFLIWCTHVHILSLMKVM